MLTENEQIERRQRERQLLAALFGDRQGESVNVTLCDNARLANQISSLLTEEVEAKKRAGHRGFHCFFCGRSDNLVHCRCGHGQKFGCGLSMTFTCKACSEAHHFIADRLRELFDLPIVNRVRGRRERAFFLLLRAANDESGCDNLRKIDEWPDDGERLRFYLSQADPFADTNQKFASTILRAFQRAKFLNWQKLVANYHAQSEEQAILSLIRLGVR